MNLNPSNYRCASAADFIGPARQVAGVLDQIIGRSLPSGAPIKILLQGPPGIGKSALLDLFLARLGASQWSVTKLNGTQLTLERLEAWAARLCYGELDGAYKVLRLEEMDKATPSALVRMLTVLDDLPSRVAIIGTSNKPLDRIESRIQSRFQVFSVAAPAQDEVAQLLGRWPLTRAAVARIATFSAGNVRLALFDAQSELDQEAAKGVAV